MPAILGTSTEYGISRYLKWRLLCKASTKWTSIRSCGSEKTGNILQDLSHRRSLTDAIDQPRVIRVSLGGETFEQVQVRFLDHWHFGPPVPKTKKQSQAQTDETRQPQWNQKEEIKFGVLQTKPNEKNNFSTFSVFSSPGRSNPMLRGNLEDLGLSKWGLKIAFVHDPSF